MTNNPIFLFLLAFVLLFSGCARLDKDRPASDVEYYTCTMHPSVKKQSPKDKCPICKMDLVPVKKKPGAAAEPAGAPPGHDHARMMAAAAAKGGGDSDPSDHPSEFSVPVERQQQIGVTYATVQKSPLRRTLRAVGIVTYDKQRHWDYVSRVEGYVQKLHVASRGDLVEMDQPLLTIYSPELLTTQREFLELLRMRDEAGQANSAASLESANRLLESAQRRLQLWNITPKQIAKLEQSRQASETLTLYSPFKGVVQDLAVDQGRRVTMGDHLVDVADLSVVWIWTEFYQDELPLVKKGLPATVTASPYPGESFTGKIAVVDPFISETRRTGRVRFEVENADFKLRPDMYVDVALDLDFGEGLTIPVSAVMPTGQRNVVFVEKGEGRLEPRFVELAGKFGTNFAVRSNLKDGEHVVSSANFLIDAEAKVQGALKSW